MIGVTQGPIYNKCMLSRCAKFDSYPFIATQADVG